MVLSPLLIGRCLKVCYSGGNKDSGSILSFAIRSSGQVCELEPPMPKLFAKSTLNAVIGGAVWFVLMPTSLSDTFEGELIQRILLLGVLVIVPLGLALVSSFSESRSQLFFGAIVLQPFAALAVIASAFVDPGFVAAGLASMWLITTGLIGLDGLVRLYRLLRSDRRSIADLSTIAGMIYLPVGAVWLIMSRLGIQPLGFGDTIVLLTAVHFHFAGFAAPVLTSLTGRHRLAGAGQRAVFVFAAVSVIAGTPLVAAGITVSPLIALVGAVVISLGLFCISFLNLFWIVPQFLSLSPKLLLIISALATVPAMVLAIAYAYSIVFHTLIVDIPQMAKTHGVINAFGFALCGLVAWVLVVNSQQGITRQLNK